MIKVKDHYFFIENLKKSFIHTFFLVILSIFFISFNCFSFYFIIIIVTTIHKNCFNDKYQE